LRNGQSARQQPKEISKPRSDSKREKREEREERRERREKREERRERREKRERDKRERDKRERETRERMSTVQLPTVLVSKIVGLMHASFNKDPFLTHFFYKIIHNDFIKKLKNFFLK
jgi:hypothetical protein